MKFFVFFVAMLLPGLAQAHGYHATDYVSVFGMHFHPEQLIAFAVVALVAIAVTSRVAYARAKNKRI